jgi:flavin-binding protein dodecin
VVKVIEILAESPNGWDDAARQAVSEAGNAVPCFRVGDLLASGGPYIFCVDLFHHVQLEIALRQHLLEPRVLLFDLLEPLDVGGRQPTEMPSRVVDGLLADSVFLRDLSDRSFGRRGSERAHNIESTDVNTNPTAKT